MQYNPGQIYKKRAEVFRKEAIALKQKYNQRAVLRLLFFVSGAFLLIYLFSIHPLFFAGSALIFIFTFYYFIKAHEKIKRKQLLAEALTQLNELEIKALQHDYAAFPDGSRFVNPDHPYSGDLDLFGPFSFFQYCNRGVTIQGQQCFAEWLQTPATSDEIINRQGATRELAPLLDWRQLFQVMETNQKNEEEGMRGVLLWLEEKPFIISDSFLRISLYLMPPIIFFAFLYIGIYVSWNVAWLPLTLPAFLIWKTKEKVDRNYTLTNKANAFLTSLSVLIQHVEEASFSHSWLQELQAPFNIGKNKASGELSRLGYIIGQLNVRDNFFAIFLNLFGLWDLHRTSQLEKWRQKNGSFLTGWFRSFAQFEAINSLSALHFNNPDWCFPQITHESFILFQEVAHPLIPVTRRVGNSLQMPAHGHIKLITGSNMAGKSTFLRTVGINMVLANAGAVVCARSCSLPLMQVFSSMRIHDDLHGNTSAFFAELKRLKMIIEAVQEASVGNKEIPVFFLLDEILKGTNSRDRHSGSRALINQLIQNQGAGLIATHDLELTSMEKEARGTIENLCMEVAVENGQLRFDYTLKKGISQSFNATQLMKQMGIRLD